jgi:hypothetical protein
MPWMIVLKKLNFRENVYNTCIKSTQFSIRNTTIYIKKK